jgi:hypothetical protein
VSVDYGVIECAFSGFTCYRLLHAFRAVPNDRHLSWPGFASVGGRVAGSRRSDRRHRARSHSDTCCRARDSPHRNCWVLTSVKSDMMCRARGRGRAKASFSSTTINDDVMWTDTGLHYHTNCQHCAWSACTAASPTHHHSSESAAQGPSLCCPARRTWQPAMMSPPTNHTPLYLPAVALSCQQVAGATAHSTPFSPPLFNPDFLSFHSESCFSVWKARRCN